jgi:tRNA threonylcarbamoyladenosine biosynthesis protein TsaE
MQNPSPRELNVPTAEAMVELGASLASFWRPGDVVLLDGPLGAGKSTLVRGVLKGLGHQGVVRSPTFNLMQSFETDPPVLHVDLYRVASHAGLGIEDYLDTHVCLIEWPDRAAGLVEPAEAWRVRIEFAKKGRKVLIVPPSPRETV